MDDQYDISKYTTKDLYDILDLNNPTDRELEAKIIHMINKYGNMQNESGYKLAIFFQNIYYHFFDTEEATDTEINEGFTTLDESTLPEKQTVKNESATSTNIVNTTNFNYTLDKFGLNPLLKQTITRIISVDSQYRTNKSNSLATNFTLNLSEPLRDVVSLTLESVQMPFAWYTISKSYGSNFFMVKGRTDGINTLKYNGYHDYKISILPGNYVLDSTKTNYICSAIQQSITDLSNTYTDINFGTTNIIYNQSTLKSTITLDIQKAFNETSFYLDLSNSPTIAHQLGFVNNTYKAYSIVSDRQYLTYPKLLNMNNDKTLYNLNSTNNSFTIVQYAYDQNNMYYSPDKMIHSFNIKLNLPIDVSYSRTVLMTNLNKMIQLCPFLDSSSSSLQLLPDTLNIYGYFQLNIKINRKTVKPVPNSKVVVIFPDERNSIHNTIWTINPNIPSCFFFDDLINDTNIIYAENNSIPASILVSDATYIYFKCITPRDYGSTNDFSLNDIVIKVPPKDYLLNDFITELNSLWIQKSEFIQHINDSQGMNAYIDETTDTFNLDIDILKTFNTGDWSIYIDPTSVLKTIYGISEGSYNLCDISNYKLQNTNYTDPGGSISTISTKIFTYFPNESLNLGNKNVRAYDLNVSTTEYPDIGELINEINFQFQIFTIVDDISNTQLPLLNTRIGLSNRDTVITLDLNINYYLTENNYSVYFYDYYADNYDTEITDITNSWNNLNIDLSYNINNLNYSSILYRNSRLITGTQLELTTIQLNSTNNSIYIKNYENNGGATENITITLTIPAYDVNNEPIYYTTYTLINTLNNLFQTDQRLVGTQFMFYFKNNHLYVKLLLNVNIIYTSTDYDIVFYDTVSFISCYVGATSVKNTAWDSTLGWLLGYHDYTDYALIPQNQVQSEYYLTSNSGNYTYQNIYSPVFKNQLIKSVYSLTGDTTTTTNLYNYFLLVLDDYIQNHLNDGLVCITNIETSIPVPYYSNQSTERICDPATNEPITISTTNIDGLTQKRIYAINQSIISSQRNNNIHSTSPNIRDVFGIISTPVSSQQPGTYYSLNGGNLNNHQRLYFGPVNISRLSIKILTDKGDILDLNGSNWSFSLICEQLYRNK
jgi:hypothetical protein